MKNLRIPLKIVFYREGNSSIAHCLEFDLMGDGETKQAALQNLSDAIMSQVQASVENDNPKNLFSPADGKYFQMFAAGDDIVVGELHLKFDSITIQDAQTREYTPDETELLCV